MAVRKISKKSENLLRCALLFTMNMDFVDKANQATMANLYHNRKKHWSTAEMVWVVTMLLTVNVKKLFESASRKVENM